MMMNKELSIVLLLAWRSVWKNKRRTVLTLLTVVIGSAMIIFLNAFATGGHEQMIEDAVSTNTGHIQIHEKGFWDNRGTDYAFQADEGLLKLLESDSRIKSFSRRIHAAGLLSCRDTTVGAMIQAVDPARENEVTDLHRHIIEGRFLDENDTTSVVLGAVLARNLGVKPGGKIALISQGFDGSIAAEKLTVVGLFNSGNPEYDQSLMIMPFAQAQQTFTMMGYINAITIHLKSPAYTDAVRDHIRRHVDTGALEVMGWDGLMPELVQFIVMDDIGAYIFDFILFMVVAFGILNTIQMSVFERIREFGVMLAIGTRPGQVTAIVIFESLFISIIGVVLGMALGSGISYYFTLNPLDYSQFADEIAVWGIATTLFPAKLTWLNITVTSFLTLGLAVLFTVFPARRAAKLNPIEAIRHL